TISARIEGTELVGTVQFAQTPAGIEAEGMVSRSEVTGISIGYVVRTWQLTESTEDIDTWTAASWELLEVSLVPVPADANAGVRSVVAPPGKPAANGEVKEEEDMLTRNAGGQPAAPAVVTVVTPPAPDTSRSIVGIAAIRSAVANAGLGDGVAFDL